MHLESALLRARGAGLVERTSGATEIRSAARVMATGPCAQIQIPARCRLTPGPATTLQKTGTSTTPWDSANPSPTEDAEEI